MSVLVEYRFKQWKAGNEMSTVSQDVDKKAQLYKESEKIQTLLYNQPMDYLKQTEMMFKIDSIADEVYDNLIKNITTKYSQKNTRRERRRGAFFRQSLNNTGFRQSLNNTGFRQSLNNRGFRPGDILLDGETEQDNLTAVEEAEKRNNN